MNRYGERAKEHWARTRPASLETLEQQGEAGTFFAVLGEEIAERVSQLMVELESQERARLNATEDDLERIGILNALRMQAEELALQEHLPPPEASPETPPETLQTVAGVTGSSPSTLSLEDQLWAAGVLMEDTDTPMPSDRQHPLWAAWAEWEQDEAPPEAGERFREAYRAWLRGLSPEVKDLLGH